MGEMLYEKVVEGLEYSLEYIRERSNPTATQKVRAMENIRQAIDLLKKQKELLDELEPPEYWIICKACGHKLRNDWNWCPWCKMEMRTK